jgi:hypothetical protein
MKLGCASIALGIVLASAHAGAHDLQRWPPSATEHGAQPVLLEIIGDEPMTITAYPRWRGADKERALFSCRTPCRVHVYPAKYGLHVQGGSDKIEGMRIVDVRGPTRVAFSLPETSARSGALALAIAGTVSASVGLMVLWGSALHATCQTCDSSEQRELDQEAKRGYWIGGGLLLAGAIASPIGWIRWAQNRKPEMQASTLGAKASQRSTPRVEIGVAPAQGGASIAVWGSF